MNSREAARATIEDACATAPSLPDLFTAVAAGLGRAVPIDAHCLNSLDPATLQVTFAHHSLRPTPEMVARFFDLEARGAGIDAVSTIARDPDGVATLDPTTGGDPARSARYRYLLRPLGLARELRVAVRDRRVPWGMVNLFRRAGSPDFSPEEGQFVASLSRVIADGIRRTSVIGAVDVQPDDVGPGLVIVDLTRPERLRHCSPDAERWMGLIDDADWHVARVARRAGASGASARARVCSPDGRWLTMHAEPYGATFVSVIIEPARPADIARLVVEAYGLSAREREIVQLLVHGRSNAEISRRLGLSRHTVGDHVKNVFAKLSVHSRAELASRLYPPVPVPAPPRTSP